MSIGYEHLKSNKSCLRDMKYLLYGTVKDMESKIEKERTIFLKRNWIRVSLFCVGKIICIILFWILFLIV